jgi:hypothetical protein
VANDVTVSTRSARSAPTPAPMSALIQRFSMTMGRAEEGGGGEDVPNGVASEVGCCGGIGGCDVMADKCLPRPLWKGSPRCGDRVQARSHRVRTGLGHRRSCLQREVASVRALPSGSTMVPRTYRSLPSIRSIMARATTMLAMGTGAR